MGSILGLPAGAERLPARRHQLQFQHGAAARGEDLVCLSYVHGPDSSGVIAAVAGSRVKRISSRLCIG